MIRSFRNTILIAFSAVLLLPAVRLNAKTESESRVKIGVVDMFTATALHPYMSLYDFNRNGFYRLPLGLSKKEFLLALQKAKSDPATIRTYQAKLDAIASESTRLSKERVTLINLKTILRSGNTDSDLLSALQKEELNIHKVDQKLALIASELKHLENRRLMLTTYMEFPEITEPEETQCVFREIEREVLEAVNNIASQAGMDLVLNVSIPHPDITDTSYKSGFVFGFGISGIESDLFYSLLAGDNDLSLNRLKQESLSAESEPASLPRSVHISRWLDVMRFPPLQNNIRLNPYPLVLKGGEDITADVAAYNLELHECDTDITKLIVSIVKARTGGLLPLSSNSAPDSDE